MTQKQSTRRWYLKRAALLGAAGIAGCTGGGGGGGGDGGGGSSGGGSGGSGGGSSGGGSGSGGGGGGSGGGGDWVFDQAQDPINTIRYQNLGSMDGDPAGAANIEAFNEEFSPLTVEPVITDPDSMLNFARTRLQGKDTKIDVYSLGAIEIWSLAPEGFLEEISAHVDQEHLDGLAPAVREAYTMPQPFHQDFSLREGLYALPGVGTEETWVPFVNMDLLEEAGYDRQISFDDFAHFKEVLADVKSQGIADPPLIFPYATTGEGGNIFMCMTAREGGEFFDGMTPTFESEEVTRATEAFLSLFDEGLATGGVTSLTEGNTAQQFFGGKAAAMINASSNIFLPGKELPIDKPAEEVARVIHYPTVTGATDTPTLNITPVGHALSSFSKNKENAVKWVNFYASKEAQKRELVIEGNLSLNTDVYNDSDVQEKVPYANIFKEGLDRGTIMRYPKPANIRQMVFDVTTAAISNGWSAEETVSKMQEDAEGIVG